MGLAASGALGDAAKICQIFMPMLCENVIIVRSQAKLDILAVNQ